MCTSTVFAQKHVYTHAHTYMKLTHTYTHTHTHTSHTRTVVRECFKGDEASQWKRPKFDPSPHQNPLTDHLHKNL